MASGVLGQQALNATTNTTVYTTPADTVAYANINVVNINATPIVVRIAIAAGSTPLAAEYIEYEAEIAGYGVLERTGMVLNSGKRIVAYSNLSSVSVAVYGVEESTV
ncbi:hypothetical protein T040910_098 [Synechococcus phage S-CAM3]|uniref:Uncharacterized protein n=1 Tax=Synechococcus phage S-CAM3 TaxID=1883366 RepID=A0A1D8KJL4_9CAUD|nr:hypothetical protein BOW87_gp160 [Synechococcus phage S-CAM3]AOV58603.1 hypothetical protein S250808_098 [Synechococcus phage S-CAM3]AOV58842.1 hypothetical protein T040910_098 [Synechococcus phage S-CAM3]AOV59081.1 hypothetical protein C421010_098 [Synechococcus phage S-CAM3]